MNKRGRIVMTALVIGLIFGALIFIYNVEAAPKKCNNGIDDDGDGLIDYPSDPGCSSNGDNNERGTIECDNGLDSSLDADILADYPNDIGCTSAFDTSEINGVCDDFVDSNLDADSLTNYPSDLGCSTYNDQSEINGACDDNINNDYDGLIDYPQDPGCISFSDQNELGTAQCDNGIDDDSDTKIDYPVDLGCSSAIDNSELNQQPNSCADSDGGIVSTIQGTTSGYVNGFPYSHTDFCLNTALVYEYYCSGTIELSANVTCMTGGNLTGTCSNGACI